MLHRVAVLAVLIVAVLHRAESAPSEASPLLAPLSVLKNATEDTFAGLSATANANETVPVQPLTVNPNHHIPTTAPVETPIASNVTLAPSPNVTASPNITELPIPTPSPKKTKVPTSKNHTSSSSGSNGGEGDITYPPKRWHYDSRTGSFVNDSSEGSVNAGDVGYLDPATVVPPPSTEPAPIPAQPAGSSVTDADANAQRAKDLSGKGGTLFSAAAFVGFAGCAAIAIAAVYTRARPHEDEVPENPFEHTAPVSIELRRTSSGVYNDPLGTRFSSIVMITPNGEGVCIL